MNAAETFRARLHGGGPPEDSVSIRVAVAAAVEVAILAVVAQGGVSGAAALLPLVLAPVGYLFSFRQRHQSNITTKVLLSVGLLAAFALFLQSVQTVGSVDQARVPLASLFLWVQVLHAFDVPRRRDLSFSMVSSVILMAEAGALSLSSSFGLFLIPWAGCAGAWLFLSSRPPVGSVATPVTVRRRAATGGVGATVRGVVGVGLAVFVATTLVFVAMPRLPGTLVRSIPFSLGGAASSVAGFGGGIDNPELPNQTGDGVVNFAPNAYPGFSDVVDLRARGHLSDALAFRVRAPQAALWRAEAFDTFDGTRWTISNDATSPLPQSFEQGAATMPSSSLVDSIGPVPTTRMIQTFYIESPQPNVLFAASIPEEVYFPSGGLRADQFGSVRAPILLDPGLVYSVVSEVPVTNARVLRLASPGGYAAVGPSYVQLPTDLPPRDTDLAVGITAGATTEYDRVAAIQSWIRAHTTYDLNVPADPPGVDAVDRFLFVTRRGFCEQIATSMAVMLRTLGIPTRLVTGFGPGVRNPLTGYFEVRQSDAHAWVEVYYPGMGWVPYDPTFGVPEAAPRPASLFIAAELWPALKRFLAAVVPEPLKALLAHAARGAGVAVRGLRRVWPIVLGLLALAIVPLASRRRRRRRGPAPPAALGAYLALTDALAQRGHPLIEHATPREYLAGVTADPRIERTVAADAEVVVATLERDRFSGRPAADADLDRAREAAARVRELVARG